MKTTTIILALFLWGCGHETETVPTQEEPKQEVQKLEIGEHGSPEDTIETFEEECVRLGYNPQIDTEIRILLDNKPRSVDWDFFQGVWVYELQYGRTLKIIVNYTPHVDFQSKENWAAEGRREDGTRVLIDPTMTQPMHRISPETFEKLKNKCLKIHKP